MTDLFARKSDAHGRARHAAIKPQSMLSKGAMHTLPILLVGSMAMTFNVTSPIDTTNLKRDDKPKDSQGQLRKIVAEAMSASSSDFAKTGTATAKDKGGLSVASSAPSTYRVTSGDTVSGIANQYGLATASILALNGLGWNSLIFPGQILQLTKTTSSVVPVTAPPVAPPPVAASSTIYTIVRGDTISAIASRFNVTTQAVLTANQLGWSTIIYPGQRITIPGTSAPAAAPSAQTPPPAQAPTPPAPVAPPVVEITPVVDVTPFVDVHTPQTISYVITSGDTVTSIAAFFGVSIQSILDANGLSRTSIIYAGRTLVIPGTSSAPASVGAPIAPLTSEMASNAKTIISVGKSLGVSDYGLVIALAAAMQESGLRNLNYGDRDSLGLFQQRPSTGWGTAAQVTDIVYASKLFFGGPNNPNTGNTRGLLDIAGWQSMTVTQAAQAVQLSGYPDAYAKWETSARAWLSQLL